MRIARVEPIALRIPFGHGGAPAELGRPGVERVLDTAAWCGSRPTPASSAGARPSATAAPTRCGRRFTMIAPIVIGRDARDIAKLSYDLQQALHLFGRYGITLFALSGLDIALWDIAGKAAGLPLHRLLGGAGQTSLPAYASLLKYRDPERVAERTKQAIEEGYQHIKLHETEEAEVRAAREAAGDGVPIMVDTNCPWTPEQARHMTLKLRQYDLHWLEEPIFPPEDFQAIARLRAGTGVRWPPARTTAPPSSSATCSRPTPSTMRSPASPRSAASPNS